MMNRLEEAIIYATEKHAGKVRKFGNMPFILHPFEVTQILATMTDDVEILAAGMLHDIVENTDGTIEDIEERFGKRVAYLVASESEEKYPNELMSASWKRRKETSINILMKTEDDGVRMLWLADKLANIRSLSRVYAERGEEMWKILNQQNPDLQLWYYKSVAEAVEMSLNRTGAFKEYIQHINFIWPGTFDSDKARYKKYREVDISGCKLLGRGAKGEVYRYDNELVIKVYNTNNTYHDVEQEIESSRRAFILRVPTAMSFGIVSVGNRYGAMYELVDSDTVSKCIARAPGQVDTYARIMADLAKRIHSIDAGNDDSFPYAKTWLIDFVNGVENEDKVLAEKCRKLISELPDSNKLIHGDFHTGNVFMQKGEPLLIDMDRMSRGDPIAEISGFYYFYVVLGEEDPSVVENFMGFSYDTAKRLFDSFIRHYMETDDESIINEVIEKSAFLSYIRYINRFWLSGNPTAEEREIIDRYMKKLEPLADKLTSLALYN